MRQILEYGVWTGAAWFLANAIFVVGWCWLHSDRRTWMGDDRKKINIFKFHDIDASRDEAGIQPLPTSVLASLGQSEITMDRAS